MLFTTGIHIQLSRDYGGQAFPIFEQSEIKIGSDRITCHIHLAPEFGVETEHVRLNRLTEKDVTISPTSSSASVFLWRSNGRRFEQIYTTTALAMGDAFSLVSPQGPKFIFNLQEFPPEVQKSRLDNFNKKKAGTGRGRLNKDSVIAEGKRQIWTRLLVFGPLQILQRASVFVTSGAIFQPRNLFLGVAILGGYIFGGVSCLRGRSARSLQATTQQRFEDCEDEKKDLEGMSSSEPSLGDLVYQITNSSEIRDTIEDDPSFRDQVIFRAQILAKSKDYKWLIAGNDQRFTQIQRWQVSVDNMIDEDVFDAGTGHVLKWMAASKEPAEYEPFHNSDDELACGRGPLRLSFRQAHNLGIPARPEAYYEGNIDDLSNAEAREELIQLTLQSAGIYESYEEGEAPPEYEYSESTPSPKKHCIYRDVEDNRKRETTLLSNLSRQIGPSAPHLPDVDADGGVSSRIAKIFAADVKGLDFTEESPSLVFDDQILSVRLEDIGSTTSRKWILDQTAEAFARSLVLPCSLVLEPRKAKEARKTLFEAEDGGPPVFACMYFHYMMTKGMD